MLVIVAVAILVSITLAITLTPSHPLPTQAEYPHGIFYGNLTEMWEGRKTTEYI